MSSRQQYDVSLFDSRCIFSFSAYCRAKKSLTVLKIIMFTAIRPSVGMLYMFNA